MSGISVLFSAFGSLLLATVFLAAALPKLRNPRSFGMTVVEYNALPVRPSLLYARLVPPAELLATLLLIGGVAVRWAAGALAVLLVSFCYAVAVNLVRNRDLDCGCFGGSANKGGRRVTPVLFAQDIGLLAVALVVIATAPPGLAPAPWSLARLAPSWPASPVAALGACALVAFAVSAALPRQKPGGGSRRGTASQSGRAGISEEERIRQLDHAG